MSKTVEDLFAGSGAPAVKFESIGDSISGTIISTEARQQRDYDSGESKTWDDGEPMMELIITLQTKLRDKAIEDDDGERRVFCRGQMLTAMRKAVRQAKGKKPEDGGTLTIKYASDGEAKRKGFSPPKLYEVTYVPPGEAAVESMFDTQEASVSVDDPDEDVAVLKAKLAALTGGK